MGIYSQFSVHYHSSLRLGFPNWKTFMDGISNLNCKSLVGVITPLRWTFILLSTYTLGDPLFVLSLFLLFSVCDWKMLKHLQIWFWPVREVVAHKSYSGHNWNNCLDTGQISVIQILDKFAIQICLVWKTLL